MIQTIDSVFLVDKVTNAIVFGMNVKDSFFTHLPIEVDERLDVIHYSGPYDMYFSYDNCYEFKLSGAEMRRINVPPEDYEYVKVMHRRCVALVSLYQEMLRKQMNLTKEILPLQPMAYQLKMEEALDFKKTGKVDENLYPLLANTARVKGIDMAQAAELIILMYNLKVKELKDIEIMRETEVHKLLNS